jgi:DNA polymerase-3 subunit epsilon
MRQVFLDTETTGLNPGQGDRIIEIGCIEMVQRRLTGRTLHFYVNPQRPSHEDAVKVHGLTDEFLADKPLFAAVVDDILAFVADAEVLAHNAEFDLGFLDAELERLGRARFTQHVAAVTDTLAIARELFPGKGNSLDALCRRLEVDNSSRSLHGALLDAGLLAEVFLRMTRGQDSLVIGLDDRDGGPSGEHAVNLAALDLPVLEPSAEELAAHEAMLGELDKACGGASVWRRAMT